VARYLYAYNALHWVGCCMTARFSSLYFHRLSRRRVEVSASHLDLTLTSLSHLSRYALASFSNLSRTSLASLPHLFHLSGPKAGRSTVFNPPFQRTDQHINPTDSPLTPLTLSSQIRLPHRTSHHHPGCVCASHLPPASQAGGRTAMGARPVTAAAPGAERRECMRVHECVRVRVQVWTAYELC
jgi:hypothetical protein